MDSGSHAMDKAMKLAVVTGLRAALGPALLATAEKNPMSKNLAMVAIGEAVLDKLPLMPSRASLPLLLPRALAAAWVARECMKESNEENPWAAPMAAAVAAGVASMAPRVRGVLHAVLGLPQPVLGLAEDYLALKLGSEAVGLPMDQLGHEAGLPVDEWKEQIRPIAQSIGAGSM